MKKTAGMAHVRPPRVTESRLMRRLGPTVAVGVAIVSLLAACGGGLRPTLVEDTPPTPEPPLEIEVPPAPVGTPPLPGGSESIAWEASVDDALAAWASNRTVPYTDRCSLVTPGPGELCDIETERETVRLLGPSENEIWYIVTVEQQSGLDFGTGYRVDEVTTAG